MDATCELVANHLEIPADAMAHGAWTLIWPEPRMRRRAGCPARPAGRLNPRPAAPPHPTSAPSWTRCD